MNQKQFRTLILICAFATFVSGFVSSRLFVSNSAYALVKEKIVQAERFQLIDSKGQVRAEIGFTKNQLPMVALYDAEEKIRVKIGAGSEGNGYISLYDQYEQMRADFSLYDKGVGSITFLNALGVALTEYGIRSDNNCPCISFWDNDRNARAYFTLDSQGIAGLMLCDKDGSTRSTYMIDGYGNAGVGFFDRNKMIRSGLKIDYEGNSTIDFYDPSGDRIWSMPEKQ